MGFSLLKEDYVKKMITSFFWIRL